MMYQCPKKLVKHKECSCFDHSQFPAHSMFISDVCWSSLGTSIFGNSSSAAIILDPDYLPDYLSNSYDYEITMMTRQMTSFFSSALRAVFVGIFHFCISRLSKFSFVKSCLCIMFQSVMCIFTWYFITSTSFAPHLFLLGRLKLNLTLLLDQSRLA